MKYRSHFPKDYAAARARFLEACQRLQGSETGADAQSFQVPSGLDQELFVDDIYVPAKKTPETLLILTSGVHGIEGATGSAIQSYFFEHLWPLVPRDRVGFYAVHCFNPYGFKYGRRSTENNVNLNRNFGASTTLYTTANDDYRKLASMFTPKKKAEADGLEKLKTLSILLRAVLLKGFSGRRLNQAIAQGQYEFPDGLEYGGKTWEPQIRFFIDRLKAFIPTYRDIVLFDLHTGLGENSQLHMIPGDSANAMNPELFKKLFNPIEDRELFALTPTDAEGFYQTTGDLNSLIPALCQLQQRVLALTFEFGTLGVGPKNKIETLNRLRLENEGFHKGYESDTAKQEIDRRFSELFYPSDPVWRDKVMTRATGLLERVLQRLN
jgi:hypothetical protein